jgi:hypothetical protein
MPLPNFLKPLHEPVVLPLAQNFPPPSIPTLPLRGLNTFLRESKLSPTVTVLLHNIRIFPWPDPLVTHLFYDGI